ncbi:hyaluronan mediated motility receptor isoform X1 [Pristis pectinata]|uniref:hyaluronan mediated motility receptor isoform X1 n=1 Tax=Pristis pectinata TaxID=685728 RepID=UPI00223E6076|nr:hyaluronan mediated motility receptor isoform X1 [Pristis pectinata]
MSFPRAPLKRFNESAGCAPAPGHYDVKQVESSKGPVSFEKANRFKKQKDTGSQMTVEVEKGLVSPASSRKNLNCTAAVGQKDATLTLELKKQKMLEQEIRCLLQQRGEQDKRLQSLEEELKKVESKLAAAVREKTSLTSNVASLERQLSELHKANELLKAKFSDDGTKKKINALCLELIEVKNKTDAKDKEEEVLKEISYLQISLESQVKLLQADLEASKATVAALQERNQSLEEMHQATKFHNDDLEKEMDKFHALTEELREENKVLQDYLEKANEQIQDLQTELSSKVSEYECKLQLVSTDMEEKCSASVVKQQQAENDLLAVQDLLKRSTEDVADLQKKLALIEQDKLKLEEAKVEAEMKLSCYLEELSQMKIQLERAKEEISLSAEQLVQKEKETISLQNCLKEREEIHCEQIHQVNKKYQHLEQEKEKVEAECHGLEQNLTRELALLKEKLVTTEQDLQQKQDQLSSIKQEKELSDSTHQQLHALHEELSKEKLELEEELEGALDELEQLQLKEMEVQELARQLEEENEMKTRQLDKLQEELDGKNAELGKMNEIHSKTVHELREEQSKSLRKLGDVEAQFESYRFSATVEMKSLQESNATLAKELAELQNQTKQQQKQLAENQISKDKAKEEYARMLLEAQMKLAQKEPELRKLEETCNLKVNELQKKLEQALARQVEKQRDDAVEERVLTELKAEVQKWQVLYEELHNKVKPFQDQLDLFEKEKNSLLSEHGATQEELNKLSADYAKLLGHQNQKQKIKHVMKLKQENVQLKQEVTKLRSQLSKEKAEQKSQEQRCQGTKRFDPAKAFRHTAKENLAPTTPLKEGNINVS